MTKRCEICKLDLQDDYSYQGHILGKKHIKNAEQKELVKSLVQRSIFVSRLPSFIPSNSILQFFSQFGEIVKHRFGPSHVLIEFKTRGPAQFLLSKPIYYRDIKLNIHPRIVNDRTPQKDNKNTAPEAINDTEDLNFDNIKSIFEVQTTFDEQLTAFLDTVAISDHEIETRYETTCTRLDEIFRHIFPKCKTYRFGSTVSGLGFKNCDLDIYMDIGFPVSQENNANSRPNVVTTSVVFKEVKQILFTKSALFSKVVPIPRAKTPIIKFTYLPTKIACDLSFKNSLAVHNSQLIKFYLSLDPRLRPTMMVIKYWVCNYELRGGNKMTKYALTLLFIFYLQQPTVRLVPSIIELKRRCVPEIVEGWQVNFDKKFVNYHQNESKSKDKSIPELLHGFFDFYANYDFKSSIICPVDGLSHSKTSLNEIELLPESMDRYKEYLKTKENPLTIPLDKPMCVQDPNELNHNVTGNVCAKYLEHFQKYCAGAAEICVSAAETNYKELLPSIFSLIVTVSPKEANISFLYYANSFLKVGLPDDLDSRTDIVDKNTFIRENWFKVTLDLIKKYFEKVLHFEIQLTNSEREQKQQKVDAQSDVHSKDQDKVILRCLGNHCLWRNRKGKMNMLDPSLSLLEKEIQISEDHLQDSNSKNTVAKVKIDFECEIIKKGGPNVHLILVLSNCGTKKIFNELGNYIQTKLPHILNKTFSHMQQFKKNNVV